MNKEELLKLPTGRVLEKFPDKTRIKLIRPIWLRQCEICQGFGAKNENMVRTERANFSILTECIDCYLLIH